MHPRQSGTGLSPARPVPVTSARRQIENVMRRDPRAGGRVVTGRTSAAIRQSRDVCQVVTDETIGSLP